MSDSKKEVSKDTLDIRYEKSKQLDSLNIKEGEKLTLRHNAFSIDTLTEYTYQIQDLIPENGKLSFSGDIIDIIKMDNNYVIRVKGSGVYSNIFSDRTYIADIFVTSAKFNDFKNLLTDKMHSNEGCFIFNCSKVISTSKLSLDSEIDGNAEDGDLSSYLTYDFDEKLIIIQGEIVEYYVYKKIEEIDE